MQPIVVEPKEEPLLKEEPQFEDERKSFFFTPIPHEDEAEQPAYTDEKTLKEVNSPPMHNKATKPDSKQEETEVQEAKTKR